MPSHHLRTRRASAPRRRTTWARSVGVTSLGTAAAYSTTNLLSNFTGAGGVQQGVTVARIRLRLAVTSAVQAGDGLNVGIIKGQDTDLGTTVVGAPNPNANMYDDWLFWSVYYAGAQPGAGPSFFPGGNNTHYEDIRAMRKLEDLEERLNLVFGFDNAGTYPQTVSWSASVLLMLP